jgi:hypothetical protein
MHLALLGECAQRLLGLMGDICRLLIPRERDEDDPQEGLSGFDGGRFCRLRDAEILMS